MPYSLWHKHHKQIQGKQLTYWKRWSYYSYWQQSVCQILHGVSCFHYFHQFCQFSLSQQGTRSLSISKYLMLKMTRIWTSPPNDLQKVFPETILIHNLIFVQLSYNVISKVSYTNIVLSLCCWRICIGNFIMALRKYSQSNVDETSCEKTSFPLHNRQVTWPMPMFSMFESLYLPIYT